MPSLLFSTIEDESQPLGPNFLNSFPRLVLSNDMHLRAIGDLETNAKRRESL